ncbi:MAG: sulfotransferase [Desulfobacterales bacterium]|nr:sulfotransferase [Desulfobacterales bacterium]
MKGLSGRPVFILGSSRSGTTLVYSIVLSSGEFALYEAETHMMVKYAVKYGNIRKRKNYNLFINDWIHSKQFSRSGLDPDIFKQKVDENHDSYANLLTTFMSLIAETQGKTRWAEQTPAHVFYLNELHVAFPEAKFIHVVRDGREVALSRRKLGWTGTKSSDPIKQLLYAALNWEIAVKSGQAAGEKIGANYTEVRYEDVIGNLDEVLKKISAFADIEIDREKVQKCTFGSLGKGNTAFGETMGGISSSGIGRWRHILSKKEIDALNFVIGKTLAILGYEVDAQEDIHSPRMLWEFKQYKTIYPLLLNIKRNLKQKTIFGRFTSV